MENFPGNLLISAFSLKLQRDFNSKVSYLCLYISRLTKKWKPIVIELLTKDDELSMYDSLVLNILDLKWYV